MSKNKPKQTPPKQSDSPASTKEENKNESPQSAPESNENSPTGTPTDGSADGTAPDSTTPDGTTPDGTEAGGGAEDNGPEDNGAEDKEDNEQEDKEQDESKPTGMDDFSLLGRDSVDGPPKKFEGWGEVESQTKPVDAYTEKRKDLWEPLPAPVAPEGRIIRNGDEVKFDGETVGNMILVKEDVYREVFARGSETPNYVRIYCKGTMVPASTMQQV